MTLPVIFGIKGIELSAEEVTLFSVHKPYGFILFARNLKESNQIKILTASLKELAPNAKIFIDQEGGRVQRIKETPYPAAGTFGEQYSQDPVNAIQATEDNYHKLMTELQSFGFDVTCAPVADLRHREGHNVIGDRSFGYDAEQVIALAKAALDGIHAAGGEGVLKHLPGHGRATLDSHLALPKVETDLAALEATDFKIFQQLAPFCAYAMTAHIIYNAIDPELPATLSTKVISYIRDNIGFSGKIMTDAIEMKALNGASGEIAKAALAAGCDLILHCNGKIEEMQAIVTALGLIE